MGIQAAVLALCVAVLLTAASAKGGNVPLSPLIYHQDIAVALKGEHSHPHGFVLKTTDIKDQDCVETSFNFNNLNDFSLQTVLSCPHPHEDKTAKQFLHHAGATAAGYCNWAFDYWNDEDDEVQLSTTPPASQVGNVQMNCWLNIGQCVDGDKYKYGQDEDAVSLIGSGVLVWVDDMYIDKVPDWFPPTDSECERYFGRIANKRNTRSGNSTSRSHASSRMPTVTPLKPAAVATAAIPAHSTPTYPDASEQPRKLWKTSVLLSTGTFSVTTRSGNSYYGGTYVHTYGFDADVTPVTYGASEGLVFTPFTVKFDFRSDENEESY